VDERSFFHRYSGTKDRLRAIGQWSLSSLSKPQVCPYGDSWHTRERGRENGSAVFSFPLIVLRLLDWILRLVVQAFEGPWNLTGVRIKLGRWTRPPSTGRRGWLTASTWPSSSIGGIVSRLPHVASVVEPSSSSALSLSSCWSLVRLDIWQEQHLPYG